MTETKIPRFATASLVFGILSLVLSWVSIIFSGVFIISAIILGGIALKRIKQENLSGKNIALVGFILGWVSLLIAVLVLASQYIHGWRT